MNAIPMKGQPALVTGANSGIGYAVAGVLAAAGGSSRLRCPLSASPGGRSRAACG